MNDCIFCRIIAGEIPSERVYEDDKMIVIRDVAPAAPVHVLMIPKAHTENIITAEPELLLYMFGKVKELAEKYGQEVLTMIGFLDGINESLLIEIDLDTVEEDTVVSLAFDKERLYKNMVAAKADWLYELPQWDAILTPEKRKELYKSQKASGTVRKAKKIFPNDPCPCGSGKKYKFCHGKN